MGKRSQKIKIKRCANILLPVERKRLCNTDIGCNTHCDGVQLDTGSHNYLSIIDVRDAWYDADNMYIVSRDLSSRYHRIDVSRLCSGDLSNEDEKRLQSIICNASASESLDPITYMQMPSSESYIIYNRSLYKVYSSYRNSSLHDIKLLHKQYAMIVNQLPLSIKIPRDVGIILYCDSVVYNFWHGPQCSTLWDKFLGHVIVIVGNHLNMKVMDGSPATVHSSIEKLYKYLDAINKFAVHFMLPIERQTWTGLRSIILEPKLLLIITDFLFVRGHNKGCLELTSDFRMKFAAGYE